MSSPSPPFPILILYGSQTGNSESIAKDLHLTLTSLVPSHHAHHITTHSMADYTKQEDTLAQLPHHHLLLFLLSTTGQGDAPDSAGKFLRILRRHLSDAQWLSGCEYGVLALGDTNYSNFCKPGVRLDGELLKMGARRWLPLACADDGTSLEAVVEPWKEKVKAKLAVEATALNSASAVSQAQTTPATTTATTATASASTSSSSSLSSSLSTSSSSPSASTASSSPSTDSASGQFKQSATAAAIQQAQQAMRAMHLARSTGTQQSLAISTLGHSPAQSTPAAASSPSPSALLSMPPSLIIFATQTGNSEAVARELHSLYSSRFTPPPTLFSMPQYLSTHSSSLSSLPTLYPLVIIVCSSTADGQPPDNALRFLRLLKKETDSSGAHWLCGMQYMILGLGDSTYDHFGGGSARVEREVVRGGGVRLMERWVADESKGLQKQVEHWKRRWMERLEQLSGERAESNSETATSTQAAAASKAQPIAQTTPFNSPPVAEQASATTAASMDASKLQDEGEQKESLPHLPAASTSLPPLSADARDTSELDDDPELRRPKVKVPKPLGLARFHPIRLSVQTSPPTLFSPSPSPASYFDRRWHNVDTEAVLKGYTPDAPFFASLSTARYLTTPLCHQQGRRVVHAELSLPWEGKDAVLYTPGDSIGVYTVNDRNVVLRLVERLGLQLDDVVEVKMRELPQAEAEKEKPVAADQSGVLRRIKAVAGVHPAAPDPVSRFASSSTPLPQPPLPFSSSPAPVLAHISTPCSVGDVFTYCVDVTAQPKKALLRMLAEYCHSAEDKTRLYQLASPAGKKEYDTMIALHSQSLLSLLTAFPSCKPPLAGLLDHLPPLQPRYYSITSSPLTHPTSIHIAYTIVEQGVCTPWLTQLCQSAGHLLDDPYRARTGQPLLGAKPSSDGLLLPVFMRRTATFTLPASLSTPLVFVGPGTGVAPFRSFLLHRRCQRLALASGGVAMGWWRGMEMDMEEETMNEDDEMKELSGRHTHTVRPPVRPPRAASATPVLLSSSSSSGTSEGERTAVGDTELFFGCRAPELDMLYQFDFESLLGDHTLTTLHTAFSRPVDGSSGCYVQQRLREQAKRVWQLLEAGGMLYVCGDGGGMAKGVMAAVVDVYRQCGGLSEKEATERVAGLMREKRYVQDIWS